MGSDSKDGTPGKCSETFWLTFSFNLQHKLSAIMIKIRIEYVLNNNKAETYRGSDSFSETNNVINDLWYSDSAT